MESINETDRKSSITDLAPIDEKVVSAVEDPTA